MHRALTIAGSDPCGGAGLQADLKTFSAFGIDGCTVITALTVQSPHRVKTVRPLSAALVENQLHEVMEHLSIDAIKIGMLSRRSIVKTISRVLREFELPPVVLDPVMNATSGAVLLEKQALSTLVSELLPLVTIITPNLKEASILSGQRVNDLPSMKKAARKILEMGPRYVLITGGHLARPGRDLLYDGRQFTVFSGKLYKASHIHGTGCTFSAAVAAGLALKWPISRTVRTAQDYLYRTIKSGETSPQGVRMLHQAISFPKASRVKD